MGKPLVSTWWFVLMHIRHCSMAGVCGLALPSVKRGYLGMGGKFTYKRWCLCVLLTFFSCLGPGLASM